MKVFLVTYEIPYEPNTLVGVRESEEEAKALGDSYGDDTHALCVWHETAETRHGRCWVKSTKDRHLPFLEIQEFDTRKNYET